LSTTVPRDFLSSLGQCDETSFVSKLIS